MMFLRFHSLMGLLPLLLLLLLHRPRALVSQILPAEDNEQAARRRSTLTWMIRIQKVKVLRT